ncbi:hypothetical protein COLO4_28692 [Corchorus olitorius]|uniref:Uncharacterized protein n=1 Tax=Corchorus olitorius TaxID=93759 RepID=A0A1R3HIN6_9ROSI|nr:hypothetical protein COLO4_28692 [Corchorus olitorius]
MEGEVVEGQGVSDYQGEAIEFFFRGRVCREWVKGDDQCSGSENPKVMENGEAFRGLCVKEKLWRDDRVRENNQGRKKMGSESCSVAGRERIERKNSLEDFLRSS